MTKWQLFSMLVSESARAVNINGVDGWIESIQREDGSGSSFNVTLRRCITLVGQFETVTVHVRTID